MEHGTLSTSVTSNALAGKWTVNNIAGVSPLFLFDAFDTFKIMFRLKVWSNAQVGCNFLIRTKGTYGDLPGLIAVSLWINNMQFLGTVSIVLDTKWMHMLTNTSFLISSVSTINFRISLPYSNISKLFPPETSFANLWQNPDADITIEAADGKQRTVHKTVLLARSDVFRAMWQNEMLESNSNHLKILELNEDSLDVFITYLYRGSTEHFNLDQCSTMLRIADKYNINDLLTKCQNILYMKLTNENVIDILTLVDLYNLPSLKARAVEYVTEIIVDIIPTKAWREANDASFFKLVYAHLIKTDSKKDIVGKGEKYAATTKHCLTIKFPTDVLRPKKGIHYMTVFPERGSGNFRLRFSEETMKLSICQCQLNSNYRFTGVAVKNIYSNDAFKSSLEEIALPDMILNKWYNVADLKCLLQEPKIALQISLAISYDLKFIPNNSAFEDLLTDSGSADMTLESSDGIFRQVHKSVLIGRNLRKMVDACDSKDHLKLCNIGILALDEFIKFVYVGDKEALDTDCCAELLTVSHIYNLPDLKYQCEVKLMTIIDVANATDLLSLAVSNKTHFMEQWVLDYVHLKTLKIIETESWQNCNNCDVFRKVIEHYVDINELVSVTTKTVSATWVPSVRKQTDEA